MPTKSPPPDNPLRTAVAFGVALGALLLIVSVAGWPAVGTADTSAAGGPGQRRFATGDQCMACHNGLSAPSGEDISIGTDWRASMMAHSGRDPYWQAAVRREAIDHPEAAELIEDECTRCHMPMANERARAAGGRGSLFANLPASRAIGGRLGRDAALAVDGVSCSVCHQVEPDGFGTPESFTGGFVVDRSRPWGQRRMYGPFEVKEAHKTIMQSASRFEPTQAEHVQRSELCATCHTLYTHALGPGGEDLGELPEQVPYLEWKHSDFRGERSCQSCHMPIVGGEARITSVLGNPRQGVSRHTFRGGNFFMTRMLSRYRAELGVEAAPHELEAAAQRTIRHLQRAAARMSIEEAELREGALHVAVRVESLAGHKLPTAYPSRRAWLHLTVHDRAGELVFESGAMQPSGAIAGNDNDDDASRYEPHHTEISDSGQVQIYEAILAGPEGEITTGLLTGIRFVKDNRLLPVGFDPETAHDDIAVQGAARDDDDFTGGGDRVRYVVDAPEDGGPYEVRAELWYQPIAYRWAQNLAGYDAPETKRFVRYYDSMAQASAVVMARAEARSAVAPVPAQDAEPQDAEPQDAEPQDAEPQDAEPQADGAQADGAR